MCNPVSLFNVDLVHEIKLLGVIIDDHVNWSFHVDFVVRKASRKLYLLRLLKRFVSKQLLVLVYNAVVRSVLEYASPLLIGTTKTNQKKMERIQKRFHRLLCGAHCEETCLEPLEERRRVAATKLFNLTLCESHILKNIAPNSHRSGRLIMHPARTSRRLRSFFPCMTVILNSSHHR